MKCARTCSPSAPLRCWTYLKTEEWVPIWALPYLIASEDGVVEFCEPNNGGQFQLDECAVLVELSEHNVECYSAEAFNQKFLLHGDAKP